MGISIWQLLIILAIVLLLFGAKRLRNLGGDLGTSVRGFRDAMKDGEKGDDEAETKDDQSSVQNRVADAKEKIIDGEVIKDKDNA